MDKVNNLRLFPTFNLSTNIHTLKKILTDGCGFDPVAHVLKSFNFSILQPKIYNFGLILL